MRLFACLVFALTMTLAAIATPAKADRDSALAAVRANAGVIDASIDDRGNLWIMVINNGKTNYPQAAASFCNVVRPHHALVFIAHVVDVTSTGKGKKSNEWTQLGQASCAK